MKKLLLAVIISSGFSLMAGAQSKFSLGPTAGIGASWISNTPNSNTKLAGNVGLSLVYSAAEHFGLGLDAKYSFEGGKYQGVSADLNYIRIPLKAIYFFSSYGHKVRPKIYAGPSFGFLAGGKTEIVGLNNPVDSKTYFKSFDFGVTAGAGLNIRLVKNMWFNADVNYTHGITDIQKSVDDTHNRNVGVNLGVNFGL